MKVFLKLHTLRAFEKQHLPWLQTLEDFDIVKAIGYHHEADMAFALKHLFEMDIGSAATINRRLKRLKQLGLVRQKRSARDGRVQLLTLRPGLQRIFDRYGQLLAT
jgi:DNA-binding MarR family transcriptional regulator